MWPFWESVIVPLLDAAGARRVIEVGAESGNTTARLLRRAAGSGGVVHAIDPSPRFDVSRWELEFGQSFQFHRGRSHDLLGRIPAADAVLLDGDHNYFTVGGELKLIADVAARESRALPLIVAHDAGWPYGRRDMYYDPGAVPTEHRQTAARSGMVPGRSELDPSGINAGHWNATREGGPRNGVLTAIEDFLRARGGCSLITVPGWHGLAVLADSRLLEERPALRKEFGRLRSAEFLREQLERIELARIRASAAPAAAGTSPAEDPSIRDYGLLDE